MKEEYKDLLEKALKVDILEVLEYVEKDLCVDFKISKTGNTVNMLCPDQVINRESSIHEDEKTSRTTVDIKRNILQCWVSGCPIGVKNPVSFIEYVYGIRFYDAIELVLTIGGIDFEKNKKLTEEEKVFLARKNYANIYNQNLRKGFALIREDKPTLTEYDILYKHGAEYVISRGLSEETCNTLNIGIGGVPNILKSEDLSILKKAKIVCQGKVNKVFFELLKGRISIPTINNNITGRAIKKDAKQRFLNAGGVEGVVNLYNALKSNKIFSFEGGFNAASYIELTKKHNVFGLQGCKTFKPRLLERLVEYKSKFELETEIIIVADPDIAGITLAKEEGKYLMKQGFSVSVIIMPVDEEGNKIDLNDILINKNGFLDKKGMTAPEYWENMVKNRMHYLIFMITQELKETAKDSSEIMKKTNQARIIEKYLKWDINPFEKQYLEKYFERKKFNYVKEMFEYVDKKYSYPKLPKVIKDVKESTKKNVEKVEEDISKEDIKKEPDIYFVEEINRDLSDMLTENGKKFQLIDLTKGHLKIENKDIILITSKKYLIRALRIANNLKYKNTVKLSLYTKEPTSILEYIVLIQSSLKIKEFKEKISNL